MSPEPEDLLDDEEEEATRMMPAPALVRAAKAAARAAAARAPAPAPAPEPTPRPSPVATGPSAAATDDDDDDEAQRTVLRGPLSPEEEAALAAIERPSSRPSRVQATVPFPQAHATPVRDERTPCPSPAPARPRVKPAEPREQSVAMAAALHGAAPTDTVALPTRPAPSEPDAPAGPKSPPSPLQLQRRRPPRSQPAPPLRRKPRRTRPLQPRRWFLRGYPAGDALAAGDAPGPAPVVATPAAIQAPGPRWDLIVIVFVIVLATAGGTYWYLFLRPH
ncbi:MAG: hypothetical protein R3F14_19305 [Polyangiaceae bacterium]